MNNFYLYQYPNGLQFLSTGTPTIIEVALCLKNIKQKPKLIGIWRFKTIKNEKTRAV